MTKTVTKFSFPYFLIGFCFNKNASLALFWMLFKSIKKYLKVFCLGPLKSVETSKSKRKQVSASQASRDENIPHENASES